MVILKKVNDEWEFENYRGKFQPKLMRKYIN